MSEFARAQLLKYGWKEGKGLGKHEDGIQQALKPRLKFDSNGLGYDVGKEFKNEWWNEMYNNAAKRIAVQTNEDSFGIIQQIPEKCKKLKKHKRQLHSYSENFIKTADTSAETSQQQEIEMEQNEFSSINVEELVWKKCKRTAHRAARLGLGLNGKLLRLQQQEELLSSHNFSNNLSMLSMAEQEQAKAKTLCKIKKKRKHKCLTEK